MSWWNDDDFPQDEPQAQSHKVCELDQLKEGRGRIAFAGTTRVAVFRIGDEIFAIKNACPYAGGSLGVGPVEGEVVACPRHDWRFNLRTGACLDQRMYRVATYPVEVREGAVYVHLEPL